MTMHSNNTSLRPKLSLRFGPPKTHASPPARHAGQPDFDLRRLVAGMVD